MQTILFVYNRHAGKDRNWAYLAEVVNALTIQGYLVTSYPTQGPGDAGEAVAKWGANYDRIVVAGGDGTLNEAISGLLTLPEQPPLGYIPIGSTNDFSKNLSLPNGNILDLAKTAVTGIPKPCDLGRFNGRPFIYVAAFGAFTDVSFNTPQSAKNLFGYSAYLLESVKRLPFLKPYQITVEYGDQELSGSYLYGMVSNTTSVAGLHLPPGDSQLDDGLLEVTLISPPKDILELESFCRGVLFNIDELKSPMMHTFSTSKVRITCQEELTWTLDGETGGVHSTCEVEVNPGAFTIVHGRND